MVIVISHKNIINYFILKEYLKILQKKNHIKWWIIIGIKLGDNERTTKDMNATLKGVFLTKNVKKSVITPKK